MSALNGDKARYQRRRQATLKRREHSRLAAAALRGDAARVAAAGVPAIEAARGPEEPGRSTGRKAESV